VRNYWYYFGKNLGASGRWILKIAGALGLVVAVSSAIAIGFITHPITTVCLALVGAYIFLVGVAAWEEWKDNSHK
jgi:hypothetical protein